MAGLWEAEFLVANARKAVTRGDTTFIAGCLFRVVELCARAVHGRSGQWVIHEKGAVSSADRLSAAVATSARAYGILAGVGSSPGQMSTAVVAAEELVPATRTACEG